MFLSLALELEDKDLVLREVESRLPPRRLSLDMTMGIFMSTMAMRDARQAWKLEFMVAILANGLKCFCGANIARPGVDFDYFHCRVFFAQRRI